MNATQEQDLSTLDISTLDTDDPSALEARILGTPAEKPEATKEEAKPEDKPAKKEAEPEKGTKPDEGPGDVRKALKEARAMARKAEDARIEREAEIERLKQEKADLEAKVKAGGDKPAALADAKLSTDDGSELETIIKAVEEDAPDLAKVMRAQAERDRIQMAEINSLKDTIGKLNEQITGVVKRDQDIVKETEAKAAEAVDKAIEATPKLAYMRDMAESDPTIAAMWEAAISEDNVLKSRGKWQKSAMTERFAEVVSRIERDFGEIKLPPEYLNKAEIEARAKKAGENAKGRPPSTLSDLPGGTPPAPDALGSLEAADPSSLMNALLGSTDIDKALEDMLRKAG